MNILDYGRMRECKTPEQVSELVQKQIAYEKMIRVTEEVSQKVTVKPEAFLNSPLVNRKRTYGCD